MRAPLLRVSCFSFMQLQSQRSIKSETWYSMTRNNCYSTITREILACMRARWGGGGRSRRTRDVGLPIHGTVLSTYREEKTLVQKCTHPLTVHLMHMASSAIVRVMHEYRK